MQSHKTQGELLEAAQKARTSGVSKKDVYSLFHDAGATADPGKRLTPKQQKNLLDRVVQNANQEGVQFKGYARGAYGQRQAVLKHVKDLGAAPGMKPADKKQTVGAKRVDLSDSPAADGPAISMFQNQGSSFTANTDKPTISAASLGSDAPQVSLGMTKK